MKIKRHDIIKRGEGGRLAAAYVTWRNKQGVALSMAVWQRKNISV